MKIICLVFVSFFAVASSAWAAGDYGCKQEVAVEKAKRIASAFAAENGYSEPQTEVPPEVTVDNNGAKWIVVISYASNPEYLPDFANAKISVTVTQPICKPIAASISFLE